MPTSRAMGKTLPPTPRGSHREEESRALPGETLPLRFDPINAVENDERAHAAAFREAVNVFGGPDALRAALGRPSTYLSKISEGMTGDRPIQSGWEMPLLRDIKARWPLLRFYNRTAHVADPVEERTVSEEDIARVGLEIDRENPMYWNAKRSEIARRLGVPVERVK